MRIREAVTADMDAVISMTADPGVIGMTEAALREELAAGRLCPEWTWVALDARGARLGRAMWWGRDATAPIALDVLDVFDVEGHIDSRATVATALLRAGTDVFANRGIRIPLPHTVRLPLDWRTRPESVHALAWRQEACAAVGLAQVNERHQFEWTADVKSDRRAGRLTYRPGTDDEFAALIGKAAHGSLDELTRRTLATTTPEQLARDELGFYLSCPGERDWWRVADDESGVTAGFVIPSATPHSRNVGYLAVLPHHRGHGYVDDLLAYVTDFHRAEGASRITATTDVVNAPMAQAFRRGGYRHVETRVELEP